VCRSDEQDAGGGGGGTGVTVDGNDVSGTAGATTLIRHRATHHVDDYDVNVDCDVPLNLEMNRTTCITSPQSALSDEHRHSCTAARQLLCYSNTTVYYGIHERSECIPVDCGVTNLIHDRRSCVDFTLEVRRMWLDVSTQA